MTVLDRIIQLRKERNWTEYRLSEESGIPQTTISSWFCKNVEPSLSSLIKISNAFNLTLSQLFAFDSKTIEITERQKQLLDNWNKLDYNQQEIILKLLKVMK